MKPFEELWKDAKSLGSDVKALAEDIYETYKEKITEDDMRTILNMFAEIDNWHDFLNNEKIDNTEATKQLEKQLEKVKKMLKEHSHMLDKVVLPLE